VVTYLDLEEVLRWAVDLLKGLLARLGDGLHSGVVEAGWAETGWRGGRSRGWDTIEESGRVRPWAQFRTVYSRVAASC
jgi:hypothetical protein